VAKFKRNLLPRGWFEAQVVERLGVGATKSFLLRAVDENGQSGDFRQTSMRVVLRLAPVILAAAKAHPILINTSRIAFQALTQGL
jgi:hypothetical protein